MKKNLISITVVLVGLFVISYLVGAFYEVSFNIATWKDMTRAAVAIVFGFLAFFALIAIPQINNEK